MENKNTLSIAYSESAPSAAVNYGSVAPARKRRALIIVAILLFIALLVTGVVLLALSNQKPTSNNSRFNNTQIDLSDVEDSGFLDANELIVLGQLSVTGGLAVTPSSQPANPRAGQIYYDQTTNILSYYNGAEFIGLDGATELQIGAGLVQSDSVLSNNGVLSLQGATGNVALTAGPGITITGTTISADVTSTGVLSLASGSPSLIINNDGNGNLTITSSGGGTGNVQTGGGTNGRIAKFTGVDTIADSIISESGSTITVTGDLGVTGNLAVNGSLSLGSPLSVANGGTGRTTLTANGVLVGQGAGAVATVTAGGSSMCLKSTGGLPVFDPCVVNSEAVTQINGLTGSITINNASGLVDEITIDDASTTQKGIAQFNATNFTAGSGIINTAQNIHSGATPTFAGLTLNGALNMGANNITGSDFSIQGITGNLSTNGTITSGLINGQTISSSANFTGTVAIANDLTLTAGDLAVNGGDVTSTGSLNVTGTGNLTLAASGASSVLLQTNGSTHLTLDSAGDLSATGDLTLQGGGLTVGTVAQAGAVVLHDGTSNTGTLQVAPLGGNQVYTLPNDTGTICLDTGNCAGSGTGVTTSGGSNNRLAKFTAAQNIEDSTITDDGTNVTTTVDVIIQGGDLTVGTSGQLASLLLHDGNGQTTTLQAGDSSGSLTFVLPTTAGLANQCLKQSGAGNQLVWDTCDGGGGGVSTTLQNAYNNGNTLATSDARDINITLADTTTDSNLNVTVADGSTSFVSFSRAAGIGTSDPAQLLLIDNLDTNRAVPAGIKLQAAAGGMTVAIDASDAEITDALSVAANNIVGTTGDINFDNFDVVGATGNITTAGDIAVNGGDVTSTGGLNVTAAGGNIALDANGSINLQDSTNVNGNLDVSGTLAVGTADAFQVDASGNVTTAGDIAVNGGNITSTGALDIGSSGQALTLLSSAGGSIEVTDSGNTTTLNFATPTANTTISFPALGAGSYELCTDSGNCSTGTLQDAYDNSANPEIVLSGGTGALTIRDGNPALGANLIEIQSNDGTVTYLAVDASGIEVTGSVEASGNISTTTGALVINGQTRLDNAGNLQNIGNLTLTGAISGGTTYSGSGNINTTGGGIQTNSITRIDNGGNLLDIGNLTATGAITIASTGAGNDVIIDGADQLVVQDAAAFNGTATFNTEVDLVLADAENLDISTVVSGTNGVNLINVGMTNNSSSGTQQLAFLQNVGGTGLTEALLALDNADADTAVTSGLIISSAAGGITTALDVSDSDIGVALLFGANNIDGTNFDVDGATGNILAAGTYNTNTFTSSVLTFGGAATVTVASAAGQALNIVAHGTSSWTTDTGDLNIGTSDVNGTLDLSGGTGVSISAPTGFVSINSSDSLFLGADNFVSLISDQGPLAFRGGDALITLDGDSVTIGHSSTDGTLLILDSKSDIGDPTGVNGAMYYNTAYGRFRCHQNNVWVDCVDGGSSQGPETVTFTSSGTFDKANYPGLVSVRVRLVGAGGGGGGVNLTTAAQAAAAGGGGGGSYCEEILHASELSASETVTVGTGGAGGAAGGNAGSAGGNSSFGSHCTGEGGGGGGLMNASVNSQISIAGLGGSGLGDGDVNIAGSDGTVGITTRDDDTGGTNVARVASTGQGGASMLGAAQRPSDSDSGANGIGGPPYGGGGSGGYNSPNQATDKSGGAGANGIVIVEVLYSGGGGGASAAEYMYARAGATQTTDVAAGDHVKFDTNFASSGSSIALDTTTAYTNGAGASIGRFTLKAGKTYRLQGTLPRVAFSANTGLLRYNWHNVTTSTNVGTHGGSLSTTFATDLAYNSYAVTIQSPSVDTVYELRLSGASDVAEIGGSNMYATAYIEVLSDGTSVAQFQGATASTDGQQGYVLKPVAGQEGSLLVGDGSWSSGMTFLNTGADRGLRLESTEDVIITLNADTDNDGSEVGSPGIEFNQDGGVVTGGIGLIQTAGTDPFGTSTTGALTNALYLGAGNNNLQFGTNGAVRMTITSAGTIEIGTSDTTGSMLVLDTKTNSGDPGGVDGAMYYNSSSGKFRCYEASQWKNCVGPAYRATATASATEFGVQNMPTMDRYEVTWKFHVSGGSFFEAARMRVNFSGSTSYDYDLQSPDPGDNVAASDKAFASTFFRVGYVGGASLPGSNGSGFFTISRIGTSSDWTVSGTFMCNSGGSLHMGTTAGIIRGIADIDDITVSGVSGSSIDSGSMTVVAY